MTAISVRRGGNRYYCILSYDQIETWDNWQEVFPYFGSSAPKSVLAAALMIWSLTQKRNTLCALNK